ncbi:MAG: dephospho-CoA kinase [Acidimicrobiales bacterium]
MSDLLSRRGAVVVDADLIARQVVEPGTAAHAALVERFGPDVLAVDGTIDRPVLAAVAFSDPDALADLNAITHPAVGAVIAERLAAESATDHVVVLDVPLLVESGRADAAAVVVVDCPPEIALARLVAGRGMSEADARRRMAAQASREERLARADRVIDNAGPVEALVPQVDRVWEWLRGLGGERSGDGHEEQRPGRTDGPQ